MKIFLAILIGLLVVGCGKRRDLSPPDIILITIDTLRWDHLSCAGYPRPTSPFLDRLAERGYIFDACYSTSSWTVPAMASLFTGLYPRSHGVKHGVVQDQKIVRQETLASSFVTLAEALKRAGYHTFGISTNGHVTRATGMAQGFDEFTELWFLDAPSAHAAALKLKSKLKDSRPYFFWIYYFDPHAPYRARSPWIKNYASDIELVQSWEGITMKKLRRRKSEIISQPAVLSAFVDLYDSEINYTDFFLQKLWKDVLESPRALVVVTSDHGEAFLEHDLIGHGKSLFEEVVRVPLIVIPPEERGKEKRISAPVSIIDIYPTILDWTGVDLPPGLEGQSLLPYLRGRNPPRGPVYCELQRGRRMEAVRSGDWKLIRKIKKKKRPLLFNLRDDPGEKENLFQRDPDRTRSLNELLDGWRKETPLFQAPRSAGKLGAKEREKLKSLGYLK